jgi:tetratricopeptide (TPR) repeat protein
MKSLIAGILLMASLFYSGLLPAQKNLRIPGFPNECPSLPAIGATAKEMGVVSPERTASDKLMNEAITLLGKLTRDNVLGAIDLLDQSVKTDATNAMAFARLGASHELSNRYADVPSKVAAERSWLNLKKALSLNPDLVYALNQLANAVIFNQKDYACAEKIYQRALAIEPESADTHFNYAILLASQGKFNDAYKHRDQALRHADSATTVRIMNNSARMRYMAHDYDWVIAHCDKLIAAKTYNTSLAHFYKGLALAEKGKFDLALAEQKIATPVNGDAGGVANLARAYVLAGDSVTGKNVLQEVLNRDARGEHVVEYQIATVYEALGDYDNTFRWLNKALDDGDGLNGWLLWINHDPRWKRIRNDSRFNEIRIRAGY